MKTSDFNFDRNTTSPGLGSKWVTPSNTAPIWPDECARQLIILAVGTVVYRGVDGVEDYWTVTSGMIPFAPPIAVTHVLASGTPGGPADGQTTTVAAGNIKAIR